MSGFCWFLSVDEQQPVLLFLLLFLRQWVCDWWEFNVLSRDSHTGGSGSAHTPKKTRTCFMTYGGDGVWKQNRGLVEWIYESDLILESNMMMTVLMDWTTERMKTGPATLSTNTAPHSRKYPRPITSDVCPSETAHDRRRRFHVDRHPELLLVRSGIMWPALPLTLSLDVIDPDLSLNPVFWDLNLYFLTI